MKKNILHLGVAAFVLLHAASAVLAEDNATTKFGRGVANIVTSPGEFYAQPLILSKDHEAPIAIFGGILKGAEMFVARECVGIYEVLTFPFPLPKGFKPIINPPTAFTDWDTYKPQN
jgi:putative exosortase-associated protein (TIGR04073 family)